MPGPQVAARSVSWLVLLALCLVGAAVGYGAAALTRRESASEIEERARHAAEAGDPDAAAAALRAAAALFDDGDRVHMLRVAASIESGARTPK